MWENYRELIQRYGTISLRKERKLISLAQQGSVKSRDEIVLRHLNFIIFRLNIKVFYPYLKRHGEDLFSAAVLILYQKIASYDLHYKDRNGKPKPVRFSSYIWKRIDGFIIDFLHRESAAARQPLYRNKLPSQNIEPYPDYY